MINNVKLILFVLFNSVVVGVILYDLKTLPRILLPLHGVYNLSCHHRVDCGQLDIMIFKMYFENIDSNHYNHNHNN